MKQGIQSWRVLVRFILYYFSIQGLLRTFFVPWRREKYESDQEGVWKWVEQGVFYLFAVIFGMIVRTCVIVVGIVALILVFLLYPLFLVIPFKIKFSSLVKKGSLGREWAYPVTYELNKHGHDMRHMTEVLVIDHDQAIARIERTLSRRTQQNVLVVGSQGIGKTTRLGYLARQMYRDLSVSNLNGKRLVQLFPEEMTTQEVRVCIDEAINARNVVLVIENIERFNIIGILEPYLDNNFFQMILTTDWEAYNEDYKHRDNLMRVTEMVEMYPPDEETTLLYLLDWVIQHKEQHRFDKEVLATVILLTSKLMMNISQPEKSIDILEELSILDVPSISVSDVETLISQKTNVPLGVLQQDEKEKLINLEATLNQYIIGQSQAVHEIASAMKRGRAGVEDSPKPMGSFLFLGPTGVGKTHTAKMLARYYFGGEHMMIRFDMSEFRELESMNNFVERLANRVEQMPFSLVFFDEIEKAHPDILNLFLQMLDEGRMHTQSGRRVSFSHTIIICTSNAGAVYMMENEIESPELLLDYIIRSGILRPEFINRFDATVLYKSLDRNSIEAVTVLALDELNDHLKKKYNLEVAITDELVKTIARKGHDIKFGVRPLDRVIQNDIETYVADILLSEEIPENRIIVIDSASIEPK